MSKQTERIMITVGEEITRKWEYMPEKNSRMRDNLELDVVLGVMQINFPLAYVDSINYPVYSYGTIVGELVLDV